MSFEDLTTRFEFLGRWAWPRKLERSLFHCSTIAIMNRYLCRTKSMLFEYYEINGTDRNTLGSRDSGR
jgi:hypothetical protein